jgi:hypothetical protein
MDYVAVKDDARRRIASARVRQLAFEIQSGRDLNDADAEMIAAVLLDLSDNREPMSSDRVRDRLREKGRAPAAIDKILRAIGL